MDAAKPKRHEHDGGGVDGATGFLAGPKLLLDSQLLAMTLRETVVPQWLSRVMTSVALVEWKTTRRARLDRLIAAHRAVTGGGTGRRALTEEINHALIVRLASEFQGFSRDLHNNTIEAVQTSLILDPFAALVFESTATTGRRLDIGNATWGNITTDFGSLGLNLASRMRLAYPARYPGWVDKLERLNRARNAIAHADQDGMADCARQQALDLRSFQRWRSALSRLAVGLDSVAGRYLVEIGVHPW